MPLAGRPFLTFMLDWVRSHGVTEVILSCGFLSDGVQAVLGDIYEGMRLRYVIEPEPLGTAGPVRLALDEGLLEDRLLVLNGDVLTDMDLTTELALHSEKEALATLALIAVEDTSSYGVVPTDDDGWVKEFLEKSDGPAPTNRINAGAYVLERSVVEEIPAGRPVSFEREVFPTLVGRGLLGWRGRGLLGRHRDPRPLPGSHLRPARRPPRQRPAAARRDQLADRRGLPDRRGAHRPPDGARRPLLGGQRHCGRALGASRWRARGPRLRHPGERAGRGRARGRGRPRGAGRAGGRGRAGRSRRAGRGRGAGRAGGDGRMTAIDPSSIERFDQAGMLADVVAQPLQLEDALWRAESAAVPAAETPGGLLVCGMGGSAIGADLANAVLGDRATRPLQVLRGYSPPGWLTSDYFVLCSSYSGETEETLACYEAARVADAPRAVLTTGGSLAEMAREDGVPVIGIPSGMQPRAAVIYMVVGRWPRPPRATWRRRCAARSSRPSRCCDSWPTTGGPARTARSPPRWRDRLNGTVPVVHGSGPTLAPAMRWKTQINENAETAGVRLGAARGQPQRDLRLGARPRPGAAVRGVPGERRPAPARAPARGADGQARPRGRRGLRAGGRPGRHPVRAGDVAGAARATW